MAQKTVIYRDIDGYSVVAWFGDAAPDPRATAAVVNDMLLSLPELAAKARPPLTKSALNHRLRRLEALGAEIGAARAETGAARAKTGAARAKTGRRRLAD